MKPVTLVRAILLALCFYSFWVTAALAHSLPGSTLTFTQVDRQLNVTITLPLEDLLIASRSLRSLDDSPLDAELSQDHTKLLASYIESHINLSQSTSALSLRLTNAKVTTANNKDVGTYKLLICELSTLLPAKESTPASESALPFTLVYDAVMHQVRNHRATVYWQSINRGTVKLVEFGFRKLNGKQKPVIVQPQ